MLPTDIETSARQTYNAVGDSFFPESNIFNWVYQAQIVLARRAFCIEQVYTASTVANQQDYAYPTNTITIKRVTVGGKKLKRITHRQDDGVTLQNSASVQNGAPSYYTEFNYTLSLRPIPDGVYAIQIYSFNLPNAVTAAGALSVPAIYHMDLVDYVLMMMFAQDQNEAMSAFYQTRWNEHVKEAVSHQKRMKRGDGFATVMSEDVLPVTILGEI